MATLGISPTSKPPYLVFLSHASYDKWVAKVICEKLESIGVKTFRDDRDIAGGDSIPTSILEAIKSCNEVLVLLSPESIQRPWVLVEIGMSLACDKRIVPMMFHIPSEQIPSMIDRNRGFSLGEFDAYLQDLQSRVTSHD